MSEDHVAICDLMTRYNKAADDIDLDAFADCFVPHATIEFVNEGIKACGEMELREMLAKSSRKGLHKTVDIEVLISGDGASSTSRLLEYHRHGGELFRAGVYDDVLRKWNGSWRFLSRRLEYQIGKLER